MINPFSDVSAWLQTNPPHTWGIPRLAWECFVQMQPDNSVRCPVAHPYAKFEL